MPGRVSISGDQRGETALANLPNVGAGGEELHIEAGGLVKVDACTAVALRALVEYHGSRCHKTVTFRPPRSGQTSALLASLLGAGLPDYFCLASGTSFPVGRSRAAILPTRRIESLDDNDEVAEGLLDLIDDEIYGCRNVALVATAFGVFGENALIHAPDSVVGTLAAIAYEREASALQLVVTDLGRGLADAEDPYEAVIDLVERSQQHGGGLDGLVADAHRKEIDLELRIASSSGRLSWRNGVPNVSEAQAVPGFTATAIIHLDQ
jgi:hypothetical protein